MTLNRSTRVVDGLFGLLDLGLGAGSILLPTGWLPQGLADGLLAGETPSSFTGHLLQEFGAALVALGLLYLWYAGRREPSRYSPRILTRMRLSRFPSNSP